MTDKDGERIARLEIQFEHLNKELRDVNSKLDLAATQLTQINNTFQQAKGAKWVIIGAASVGGFLSAKLGWLLPPLFGK